MSENKGVFPKFYLKSVQHTADSREAGRPIFRDVEWVDIVIAGDKNSLISRKVRDDDRQRFPAQYEAFKKGLEAPVEGTPLKEWPILTPAQVSELQYLNFYTVESVAEMPDTAIQAIGLGGREIKNKAVEWLKSAGNGAVSQKLVDENAQLKRDIEMLKEQLAQLNSMVGKQDSADEDEPVEKKAAPKKRRGRPPKKTEPVSALAAGV